MKIITKNCSLTKGVRGYLIYLTDDSGNSLECYDVTGEEERLGTKRGYFLIKVPSFFLYKHLHFLLFSLILYKITKQYINEKMKIITKNCSLTKGVRGYLIYLTDDSGNSLECYDVTGEEERLGKENELSELHGIGGESLEYVTLEKYKSQHNNYTPLILVFYLNEELFTMQDAIKSYGENVRQYLENKGDNVRLFFLPTKEPEKITCINPVFIEDEGEFDKLNDLIEDITNKFQVGVE